MLQETVIHDGDVESTAQLELIMPMPSDLCHVGGKDAVPIPHGQPEWVTFEVPEKLEEG